VALTTIFVSVLSVVPVELLAYWAVESCADAESEARHTAASKKSFFMVSEFLL
jgi:hypothetical protein